MINNLIIFTLINISLLFLTGCEQKVKSQTEAKTNPQEELIQIGEFSDGAKLYNDELREDCKMSGFSLARQKTKDQWEKIAKNGKLADTITTLCPKVEFNNLWTPDIYEYLYKNAPDSKS